MPAPAKKPVKQADSQRIVSAGAKAIKAAAPNRAGRRAAEPEAPKYTLGIQAATPIEQLYDLRVPSGALCQVRRPGVQGLIKSGILDSFDSLTALVKTEHFDRNDPAAKEKADSAAATAFAEDPSQVLAGFAMIDRLVAAVVAQPALWADSKGPKETDAAYAARAAEAERDGAIPCSNVDLEDRIFIMNWAVGGSADLAEFREGLGSTLADLPKL